MIKAQHLWCNRRAGICAVLAVMWTHGQEMVPFLLGQDMVRTTVFRGRELSYEVIDGMAIHGGDIILGTAEEAAAASPRPGPTASRISKARLAAPDRLSAATAVESEYFWPGGVIPYVIDDDSTNSEDILRAIEEWNSKTVISLVDRTTEEDYVRFRSANGGCSAYQGRAGGEQFILLHETCDWRIVVHEIGHAVGMWHEHQRQDRDRYLMVHEGFVSVCSNPFDLRPEARVRRPYDYASAMHYGRGPYPDLPWMDTIPPGISIVSAFTPAPLSSGDIDYVARLYGRPPSATTISTNPPGLDIIVDGIRYATPASFDWAPGSTHHIEAPLLQTAHDTILGHCCNYDSVAPSDEDELTRLVFGGWTDRRGRAHSITVDADTTWYQANYIVQVYVPTEVQPPEAGRMTIAPESPDGFHTIGAGVEISAEANPGYNFLDWRGRWMPGTDRIKWFSGDSWNPARVHVGLNGRAPQIYPYFWASPVFSVDAEGFAHAPFIVNSRGWRVGLPKNYTVDHFRSEFGDDDGNVKVAAADDGVSYVEPSPSFLRWGDGVVGSRTEDDHIVREVDVPDEGGELATEWETHVPLFDARISGRGRVDAYPPPLENNKIGYWSGGAMYYVQGTRVEMTAEPESPEDRFVGWARDAYGTDPMITVVMDGPKRVDAVFSHLPILQPGEPESGELSRLAGYWTYVPVGATELAVDVEMEESEADAILAVSQGGAIEIDDNEQIQGAEFQAHVSNGAARIAITRESSPPITAGPYFIRVVAVAKARTMGTLNATVARGLPVQVFPRAFTFVSSGGFEPTAQTFELSNKGDGQVSYRIDSGQKWLKVAPRSGTLPVDGTAEVTVSVQNTGLPDDTHTGELTIVHSEQDSPRDPYGLGAFGAVLQDVLGIHREVEGVVIQVTFAVVE